jgi:hypothetical protein
MRASVESTVGSHALVLSISAVVSISAVHMLDIVPTIAHERLAAVLIVTRLFCGSVCGHEWVWRVRFAIAGQLAQLYPCVLTRVLWASCCSASCGWDTSAPASRLIMRVDVDAEGNNNIK